MNKGDYVKVINSAESIFRQGEYLQVLDFKGNKVDCKSNSRRLSGVISVGSLQRM
jgi:hypothetical protein